MMWGNSIISQYKSHLREQVAFFVVAQYIESIHLHIQWATTVAATVRQNDVKASIKSPPIRRILGERRWYYIISNNGLR